MKNNSAIFSVIIYKTGFGDRQMRTFVTAVAFVSFAVAVFALGVVLLPNLNPFEKQTATKENSPSLSELDSLRAEIHLLKRENTDQKTLLASLQQELDSLKAILETMKKNEESAKTASESVGPKSEAHYSADSPKTEQVSKETIRREVAAALEEIRRTEHRNALLEKKEHLQKELENEIRWRLEELDRISKERLQWEPQMLENIKQIVQRRIQALHTIRTFAIETELRDDISSEEKERLIGEYKQKTADSLKADEDLLIQLLGKELYSRLKEHLKM